jgi:hypothetical protein
MTLALCFLHEQDLRVQLTRPVWVDRVFEALGNNIESGLANGIQAGHHVLIHRSLWMITVRSRHRRFQGPYGARYMYIYAQRGR